MTKMDGRAFHHHRGALRSIVKNERLGEGEFTPAAVTHANVQTTAARRWIDTEPALQQNSKWVDTPAACPLWGW
jgi:hypothetical protein